MQLERCGVCAHFGREVIFPGEHVSGGALRGARVNSESGVAGAQPPPLPSGYAHLCCPLFRVQDRQPPTATFKTEARYVNQDPIPQSYSHYRLGSIIRTKVFIEERYVPAPDPHIPMTVGVEVSARQLHQHHRWRRNAAHASHPPTARRLLPRRRLQESAASGRRKETSDRDEFDEPDKHARHVLGKGEWWSW